MSHYIPKNLLSTNNNKTVKGEKYGWKTYILYMSPFTQNSTGKNVCSHASNGCAEACLHGSGFGGMFPDVVKGRMNKADYFFADRIGFFTQLYNEIEKIIKKHKKFVGLDLVCIRRHICSVPLVNLRNIRLQTSWFRRQNFHQSPAMFTCSPHPRGHLILLVGRWLCASCFS